MRICMQSAMMAPRKAHVMQRTQLLLQGRLLRIVLLHLVHDHAPFRVGTDGSDKHVCIAIRDLQPWQPVSALPLVINDEHHMVVSCAGVR
jgi:hypothetical protein